MVEEDLDSGFERRMLEEFELIKKLDTELLETGAIQDGEDIAICFPVTDKDLTTPELGSRRSPVLYLSRGKRKTCHHAVLIPSGSKISSVNGYVKNDHGSNGTWQGKPLSKNSMTKPDQGECRFFNYYTVPGFRGLEVRTIFSTWSKKYGRSSYIEVKYT